MDWRIDMQMSDFTTRLRAIAGRRSDYPPLDALHEAAVVIDGLERKQATLRQQLADMQALAYYYPPTAPFALDGVTWKQRAEEAERKLENPDVEKVARAICLFQVSDPDKYHPGFKKYSWQLWEREAKAAIAAMQSIEDAK
jgi:hypothetical protein